MHGQLPDLESSEGLWQIQATLRAARAPEGDAVTYRRPRPPRGPGREAAHTEGGIAVVADAQRSGRHRGGPSRLQNRLHQYRTRLAAFTSGDRDTARLRLHLRSDRVADGRMRLTRFLVIGAAIITVAALALVGSLHDGSANTHPGTRPGTFLGVFVPGVPQSYAGVSAFTANTQVRPRLVVYYSGWMEPFQARFAGVAARHGAAPLVQIDPTGVRLTSIASGRYDAYLRSYASAVKNFGRPVVLSFGPEMNGTWYTWGYRHTSAPVFVAAWRHVVTVFRSAGARNVTWLWTINVVQCRCRIPPPASWWPGNSYVDWVGIDGYYYQRSLKFAALFGPTIKDVRALTLKPIIISETAAPAASQPAKIADLFAGVRSYGLLGFVWFDHSKDQAWGISSPAAFAAFRRGAESLKRSPL
jgi:mannan endo-1,4-beta-mannosidase